MATQFDQQRVVVQPQATEQPADLTGVFNKQASFMSGLSDQYYQQSTQYLQQASSWFDQALAVYGKEAERKATDDAAAMIKWDGEGNVIPPSSFYPPGISSRAYSERYHDVAKSLYNQSAEDELTRHSALLREKFAGNPAAYAAGMAEKRQQMQVNLDPTAAPWIDLRGRQIQAQGASVLAVQAQTDQNKYTAQKADEQYAGILTDATKLAGFQAGQYENQTPEQLNSLILNSSMLGERWKQYEVKAVAAGYSPAMIQQRKDNLAQNVIIKAHSEIVKGSVSQYYDPQTGYPNPGAIADARENIRQSAKAFAQKFPGHEKDYYDEVNGALDFATGQAGLRAQQVNVNGQKLADPKLRAIALAPQLADDALRAGDLVAADSIRAKLAADTRDYLTDPKIPDSVALRLGSASYAAAGTTLGKLQENISNRLQGLNAVINDTNPATSSVQSKATAEYELRAIKADPETMQNMTPGQRAYLQSGLDKVASVRLGADTAGIRLAAAKGDSGSPQSWAEMFQKRTAMGIDGDHVGAQLTGPEQTQLLAQYTAAYNAKDTAAQRAQSALRASKAGQTPTAEDIAGAKIAAPYRLPGQVPDYTDPAHGYAYGKPNDAPYIKPDPAQPGHTASLLAHLDRYNYLPDAWKDSIDQMPHDTNQAVMQPWIDMYKGIYEVAAKKVMQRTGGERPSDVDLRGQVAGMIGSTQANYLSIAAGNGERGAEAAYKIFTNPSMSISGNTGGPAAVVNEQMKNAGNEYMQQVLAAGQTSSWLSMVTSGRFPMTKGWDPTEGEQALRALTSTSPQMRPGLVETAVGTTLWGPNALPSSGKMDPELDARISARANALMALNGEAYKVGNKTGTPEGYAYRIAAEELKDSIEGRRDPADPNGVIFGLKSANKAFGEKAGVERFDDPTMRAVVNQVALLDRELSGDTGAKWDKDSIVIKPYLDATNQPRWYIGANEERTGMRMKLLDVSQNDPRFQATALVMDKNAMTSLNNNLVGSNGQPADKDTVARWGVAISRVLQGPFENMLKEHYAAGTVLTPEAHTAAINELRDRFTALRTQQGLPSIDWRKSLENIAKNSSPDTGLHGMIRELMRQGDAASMTERKEPTAPPAVTNPVVLPPSQPMNTGPDAAAEAAARAAAEQAPNKRGR